MLKAKISIYLKATGTLYFGKTVRNKVYKPAAKAAAAAFARKTLEKYAELFGGDYVDQLKHGGERLAAIGQLLKDLIKDMSDIEMQKFVSDFKDESDQLKQEIEQNIEKLNTSLQSIVDHREFYRLRKYCADKAKVYNEILSQGSVRRSEKDTAFVIEYEKCEKIVDEFKIIVHREGDLNDLEKKYKEDLRLLKEKLKYLTSFKSRHLNLV